MVVKSATKKKLMDLGFSEAMSNTLAEDRKWDDVKDLSPDEIYEIIRHNLGLKVDSKKGDYGHWDYTDKVALWRKLGRLEIKVGKNSGGDVDTDYVYISVPYLDEYSGMYNFRTGVLTPRHDGFRGLGSLFSGPTIFDWHFVGPSNKVKLPEDVIGNEGYLTIMNQIQTEQLSKILRKLERAYLFPVAYESINRADILSLWDIPDDKDFDGLGSIFG